MTGSMLRWSIARWLVILVAFGALAITGCGDDDSSGGAANPETETSESPAGEPSGVAVLGHSGATGENSDPDRPGVEVRANSWATGTNPEVKSVYSRLLALDESIKGHNTNLAEAGATVFDVLLQAEEAVELDPPPELILIQIMDNDIICPARASDYTDFGSTLSDALTTLTGGIPDASIFVVSQFGNPTDFTKALSPAQLQQVDATDPCAVFDANGKLVPAKLDRLEEIIHGYEAELESTCEDFDQCTYDGGAFGGVVDEAEYHASDLDHLSVTGHAKAAAVAWAALKSAGVVPDEVPK